MCEKVRMLKDIEVTWLGFYIQMVRFKTFYIRILVHLFRFHPGPFPSVSCPVTSSFFSIWILFSNGVLCICFLSIRVLSHPHRFVLSSCDVGPSPFGHSAFRRFKGTVSWDGFGFWWHAWLVLGLHRCSNDFILQNTCHQKRNPSRETVPLNYDIQGSGADYTVSTGYTGGQHAIFMRWRGKGHLFWWVTSLTKLK